MCSEFLFFNHVLYVRVEYVVTNRTFGIGFLPCFHPRSYNCPTGFNKGMLYNIQSIQSFEEWGVGGMGGFDLCYCYVIQCYSLSCWISIRLYTTPVSFKYFGKAYRAHIFKKVGSCNIL